MKIAIIGASKDKRKFSNKAIRAYKKNHHVVFPVTPSEREVEGLKCYGTIFEIPLEIDAVSLYVPPAVGIKIIDDIIKMKIKKVYLNPGTESEEIKTRLINHKINVKLVCSIKDIGEDPNKF